MPNGRLGPGYVCPWPPVPMNGFTKGVSAGGSDGSTRAAIEGTQAIAAASPTRANVHATADGEGTAPFSLNRSASGTCAADRVKYNAETVARDPPADFCDRDRDQTDGIRSIAHRRPHRSRRVEDRVADDAAKRDRRLARRDRSRDGRTLRRVSRARGPSHQM